MSMGDVSVVYPIMVQLWRVGSSSYNICGYRTSQHATPQIPGGRGLRNKKLRNHSWSSRRRQLVESAVVELGRGSGKAGIGEYILLLVVN